MSTDNRTLLNNCSAAFTGGDDTGSTTTLAGLFYETSALSVQFTDADERTFTTNIGGTRDLSDATCYMLAKDNLIQTQALGGVKYILYDGTDEIGYEIGGNDNSGIPLNEFFNGYKLDVSNSAAFTAHAFAGSEGALTKTAITGVGYGTNHLAKAQGSIDNCFLDQFYFMANGSAALTINGGSSGTPITLSTTAADDITNGWGLVSNPQGEQYNIFCPTEWGDTGTASTYFSEANSQITLIGTGIGVGNFDMSVVANSTGTNLFQLDNCVVVSLGAVANWDLSDTNIDTLEITNTQFVDQGTFTFPVTGGTSRLCSGSTFVNCGQVDPSTMAFTGITFIGTTDANGALLGNKDIDGLSFTSDGTGHAIYITTPGTYDYTSNTFTGYGADTSTDAVIYNNSGGAVTINANSGDIPTYRDGASATTSVISGQATITVTCIDSITASPIESVGIIVRATTTGNEPFEDVVTIVQAAGTATVTHTAHGFATNNYVEIKNAVQSNYNRAKQITVVDANSYTYAVPSGTVSPATGTILATSILLYGDTDVNGELSDTRGYTIDQGISGDAKKGSSTPTYISSPITGTIDKDAGVALTISMTSDD